MSYSFENLKSKITSLQARNHGTSSASTAGTTASTDDINADSFQSLASLQDAAEKRRLYTKHKRHLSMSRDKIIQANKVKRPTSTPLVHLEPETSHEGVPSADAQSSDRTNKPNSVLLSAVRNRVRNNDALGLKLKIPAKSSTPDASPCSTPGGGGGGTTPCCSPLTPGIVGAIALSRARSCSMVELYNQEGRQMKFQKSTFDVELLKKPGGKKLGFTVVGGLDTPGRPMGIYIKTIQPDGLAAEEGTLKQGDEILEVNGVTFTGMTHQEAVSVFRKLKKGTVRINIRRFMPVAQTRKDSLDEGVSVTSFPMSPSVEGGPWRHPLERRRSSDDVLEYSHREAEDSGVEKAEAPLSKSENSAEFVLSAGQTELSIAPNSVFDPPSLENAENAEEQVTEGSKTPADGLANSCLNVAMETETSDTMQEKLKPVHQLEVNNSNPGTSYSVSNVPSHQSGDVELDWGPISDDISDLVGSFGPSEPLPLSPRKRGMPHGLRPRRPSTPRFMESQGSEDGSDKELEASVREFMSETSFVPIEKNPLPVEDVERSYETPPPPVFENNSSSLTTITTMEELPDEKRITKEEEPRDLTSRETALSEYDDVFAEDARTSSMTSLGDHVTAARRSTKLPLDRLPDSPEIVNLDSKSDDAVLEMVAKDLLQVQSLDTIALPSAGLGDQNYNALNPEEGLAFDQETMTTILEEPEEHVMTVSGNNLLRQASNFVEKEPSNQDETSISPDRDDISAGYQDIVTSSRVEPVKADAENPIYDATLNDGLEEALGMRHLEEDGQETVMTQSDGNAESENPNFTEKSVNSDSKSLELQEDFKTSETDKIHTSESSPASKNIDSETQTAVQSLEFQDPSSERERPSDCSMPDESSDRKSDSCLAEGTRYSFSNSSPTEDDEQLFRPERFLELMLEPITPEATDKASSSSTCTQLEPSRQEDPGEGYHFPKTSGSSLVEENKAGLQVGDIPNDLQFKYSKNIESSCSTEASVTRCGINDDASEGMPSDSNVEGDLQDSKKQRGRNSPDFFQQNDLDIGNHSDDKNLAVLPREETKDNENFELNAVNSSDFFLTSEMIGLNTSTSTSPNSKSENSNPVDLDEAEGSSENLSRETDVETRPFNEKQTISNVEHSDVFLDNTTVPLTTTGLKSNFDVDDDATLVITSTRLNADLISRETDHLTLKPNRDCTLSLKQKNGLADAIQLKDKLGYLNQDNTVAEEHRNSSFADTLASFDVIPKNRLQDSIDLKPSEAALEPDRNETELSSTVFSKGFYRNEDLSNVLASHDSESLPHVSLPPDNLESKSGSNDVHENSPTFLGVGHAKTTKQQFRITPERRSGTELSFFALDIKDDVLPQTGNIGADSDNLDSIPPLPASKPPSVEDSTFFQAVNDVPDTITQNRNSPVSSFSTDFNDNEIVRPNDELITSTVDANGDSLLPHSERQELFTNCIRVSCDSRGLAGDISAEKNSTQTFDKHETEDKRGNYFQGTGAPPRQKLSIRFLQGSEGNIHWKNVDRTEERQIHSHSEERSSTRYQISSPSKDSLDLGAEDCLVGTEGQNQDPNSVPIAILSWCSTNPSNGSSSHPVNPVD